MKKDPRILYPQSEISPMKSNTLCLTNSSENLNPSSDGGASVYQAALGMLDQAITNFNAGGVPPTYDMYYQGDASKWIKAANSIKKRAYLNLGDYASYSSITNYITSNSDDFEFQWGTNTSNPDTRSPIYRSNYTLNGASDFQSNWLMNRLMVGRNGVRDARINYLIYRQESQTPGIDGPVDETLLQCAVPGYFIAVSYTHLTLPTICSV